MSKDEWLNRFAAYVVKHMNISREYALAVAATYYNNVEESEMPDTPEEAAMDELSCWADDEGDE